MIFFKFFILGIFFSLIFPPFFMLPLGFIIFPYFINLISQIKYKQSFTALFCSGFLFGIGFLLIYLLWIPSPFLVNEYTKPYALVGLILPIFLSIFFGLIFCIYKYFRKLLHLILVTPVIFILIEICISNLFYGFPWVSNSLILSNNFFGFYIIKYFGTITSGYIIISTFLLTSFLYFTFKEKYFKKVFFLNYASLIFILLIPFILISFEDNDISKEITIDAYQILKPINQKNKNEIKSNIIQLINNSNSDYVIFAENNFPYIVDKNNYSQLSSLLNNDKKIIIGATTFSEGNYFNSFLLLEKDKVHFFDKKYLVPFGEFLPFRRYLNFMELISGSTDFKEGNIERLITTEDNLKIMPIICYEIIFDKIYNKINEKKIDILINITNDSWFGNKIGPYQHFYITRVKSLIANKPLIRVSNNGISAIFDNNGKIIKFTKLNHKNNIKYKLKINTSKNYIYLHKIFPYFLFFIFIMLIRLNKRNF